MTEQSSGLKTGLTEQRTELMDNLTSPENTKNSERDYGGFSESDTGFKTTPTAYTPVTNGALAALRNKPETDAAGISASVQGTADSVKVQKTAEKKKEKKEHRFRITFNAPVVLWFSAICLAATIAGYLSNGYLTRLLFMTYRGPLSNPMTYVRLFTHVLGHSGFSHFIGNASYLLLLGPMLEEKYGSKALLEVIAITALITGVINSVFFPNVALCGASGVVFAFIILASFTNFKQGEIPLTFILVALIYIGQQVFEGLTVSDNISNMAHIVGGLVGSVTGYILNRKGSKK